MDASSQFSLVDYVKVATWNAHTISAVSCDNRAFNHLLSADTDSSECMIRVFRLPNSDLNSFASISIFACKLMQGENEAGLVWHVSGFDGKMVQTYNCTKHGVVDGIACQSSEDAALQENPRKRTPTKQMFISTILSQLFFGAYKATVYEARVADVFHT